MAILKRQKSSSKVVIIDSIKTVRPAHQDDMSLATPYLTHHVLPTVPSLEIFAHDSNEIIREKTQAYEETIRRTLADEMAHYRQKALADLESEKQAIFQGAYQEGVERGRHDMRRHFENLGNEWVSHAEELARARTEMIQYNKDDIVLLALEIANRIVLQHLTDHPEVFVHMIDQAIDRITDKDKVVLRISPQQVDLVRAHKDSILSRINDIKNLEIQSDPKLEFGSCIIETKMGYVDATLPTQFETLKQALLGISDDDSI